MPELDTPQENDNRKYNYSGHAASDRIEYPFIVDFVEKNSKVIDLGCGNGSLLEKLIKEKNVQATGIEISESGVTVCTKKGLEVLLGKIDETLPFPDNTFDFAICNVTIQMVMYPEILMKEMKRIARYQIISFPNFAYWHNRLDLLVHGRMPQPLLFGYSWYSTGHIHQLSIKDFEKMCKEFNCNIIKNIPVFSSQKGWKKYFFQKFQNLFSLENIYLLEK